jgi:hypothetical protein
MSAESTGFELVTEVEVDSRGRVSIARAGGQPGTRYRICRRADGDLLLTPVVSIPQREMLVWENPELARSILAALDEAERGETRDLGDFSQYLDEEDDG